MIVIVMGVAGSEKTTLGSALAQALDWEFVEGDDFHPPHNIEKMRHGEPLNDADRAPWLAQLHRYLATLDHQDRDAFIDTKYARFPTADILECERGDLEYGRRECEQQPGAAPL